MTGFISRKINWTVLLLIVAAAFLMLFRLGAGSLSSWDEAFYAQVSREMLESNNWLELTWGGQPWSDKPPLYMWGTVVFYRLFGVNELSTRLFSSVAGILAVICTYLFASKIFSRKEGIISALMLLSTYHFLWFARSGTLDVTFTLFTLLSAYFFLLSEEKRVYVIYSFISFSLAFLTKGTGALLIPMILGMYVIFRQKWHLIFNKYVSLGACISLAILGIWYIPAYLSYGRFFLENHFLQNLVTRTTGTMDGHHGSWLAYINAVLYKGKPWGTLGLITFPVFIFHVIKKQKLKEWILIAWALVTFLVFSIAKTKLHWYIIPVYPAVVIVAGWGVSRVLKKYAVICVIICSLISIMYFGAKKDIFAMDFNPAIKEFSIAAKEKIKNGEKIYLYGAGDPGIKFYFGGFGENINSEKELQAILKDGKSVVIVGETAMFREKGISGEIVVIGPDRMRAIRVEG